MELVTTRAVHQGPTMDSKHIRKRLPAYIAASGAMGAGW